MPAYLIANIDVHDLNLFQQYRERVPPIIAKFGGRYLVRGGEAQAVEGDLAVKRLVIIEFPDMTKLRAFYDGADYQAILPLRTNSARSDIVLVPGYEG